MGKDVIVNRAWKVQPWKYRPASVGQEGRGEHCWGGGSLKGLPGEAVIWAKLGRQRQSLTLLPALMVPEHVCLKDAEV